MQPYRLTKISHVSLLLQKSTANANLAHNKIDRERNGMEEMARPITNWGAFGKKQVASLQ
jgi:hypothetical protein